MLKGFFCNFLGGGSWNGSIKASDFNGEGMSPIFSKLLPTSDEVKQATEHFTVALSSLKVVSDVKIRVEDSLL